MNISFLAEKIKRGIKNLKVFIFSVKPSKNVIARSKRSERRSNPEDFGLVKRLLRLTNVSLAMTKGRKIASFFFGKLRVIHNDMMNCLQTLLIRKFSKKQKILVLVLIVLALILPFHFSKAGWLEDWIIGPIIYLIVWAIFGIFETLAIIGLFISEQLLNAAYQPNIYNVVIGTTSSGSAFIQAGWTFTRDIANLFFIFILLVIAFGTILRLPSYNLKNLLPKLLIAAFLINFSKVFTMLVIDIANVFMYGIGSWVPAGSTGVNFITQIIYEQFMPVFDPLEMIKNIMSGQSLANAVNVVALFIITVVTMFVLLALAAFLVIRVAMLAILIILSPAAFICSVLPQTQKWASKWWEELVNYSIIGPIFVFFLYLSSEVAKVVFTDPGLRLAMPADPKHVANQVEGISWLIAMVIPYVVVIVFLLAGLYMTRSLGIYGASAISGFTTGAIGGIAGAATGYTAVKRRYKAWRQTREAIAEEKARRSPWIGRALKLEGVLKKTPSVLTRGKIGKRWGEEELRKAEEMKRREVYEEYKKAKEERPDEATMKKKIKEDPNSAQAAAYAKILQEQEKIAAEEIDDFAKVFYDAKGKVKPALKGLLEEFKEGLRGTNVEAYTKLERTYNREGWEKDYEKAVGTEKAKEFAAKSEKEKDLEALRFETSRLRTDQIVKQDNDMYKLWEDSGKVNEAFFKVIVEDERALARVLRDATDYKRKLIKDYLKEADPAKYARLIEKKSQKEKEAFEAEQKRLKEEERI